MLQYSKIEVLFLVGVPVVYANKLEKRSVQTTKAVENEYYKYLNELFEHYAINVNKQEVNAAGIEINKHDQQKLIREALMKGYVEMSHINLTICLESQYAEYEAQHTTERLVSGG